MDNVVLTEEERKIVLKLFYLKLSFVNDDISVLPEDQKKLFHKLGGKE